MALPWGGWGVFGVGILLGGAAAWLMQRGRSTAAEARVEELRRQVQAAGEGFDGIRRKLEETERARVTAETRASETEKRVAEQQALLEEAKKTLTDTFNALAAKALAENNTGFLTLAEQRFKALKETADADLASRQEAVGVLVKPLERALTEYQQEARQLEQLRQRELGSVGRQLTDVAAAQMALQQETARLVGALASAQIRGRWGEISLRRCVELAGMQDFCDFKEQATRVTEEGRLRPDMVITMPAGREVVVDAKVPMVGYDEWRQAGSDPDRDTALDRHVACIMQHVTQLASREYWEPYQSAEFVVMFIPNDTFLAAATQKDPGLVEAAMQKRVVIATPSTLYGLLRAVEYGWRQEQLAKNAQRISALGQEMLDRLSTVIEHLNRVGASLGKAVGAYNRAAASVEQRLVPTARKFKELGVGSKKEMEELILIEQRPTTVVEAELNDPVAELVNPLEGVSHD